MTQGRCDGASSSDLVRQTIQPPTTKILASSRHLARSPVQAHPDVVERELYHQETGQNVGQGAAPPPGGAGGRRGGRRRGRSVGVLVRGRGGRRGDGRRGRRGVRPDAPGGEQQRRVLLVRRRGERRRKRGRGGGGGAGAGSGPGAQGPGQGQQGGAGGGGRRRPGRHPFRHEHHPRPPGRLAGRGRDVRRRPSGLRPPDSPLARLRLRPRRPGPGRGRPVPPGGGAGRTRRRRGRSSPRPSAAGGAGAER